MADVRMYFMSQTNLLFYQLKCLDFFLVKVTQVQNKATKLYHSLFTLGNLIICYPEANNTNNTSWAAIII